MQISAVSLFCLWLTIVCIGYIFVEILRWDKYFLRKSLIRNNNYRLDRLIHYIVRGLILNLVWISSIILFHWSIDSLADLFNQSWELWWILGIDKTSKLNAQLSLFSVFYFTIYLLLFLVIWLLSLRINNCKSNKKIKKSVQKK